MDRPKLGVYLDLGEYPTDYAAATTARTPEANRWPDILAKARLAEEIGFDSIWIPDHLIFGVEAGKRERFWECTSVLAALAASTTRAELGALVACTAYRNPALLAKIAATIDEISSGRLILGLGAEFYDLEFEAFGYPTGKLASRFEEAIQIIHGLLKNGAVDIDGRFYSARECELRPRGPRPEGPPLMIAARGPRMMGLAARYGDYWNEVFVNAEPDHVTKYRALSARLDAACEEIDRNPSTIGRSAAVFLRGSEDDDWTRNGQLVTGSPAALVRFLSGFVEAGANHLIVIPAPQSLEGIASMGHVIDRWKSMEEITS